jgi:hypothetical protein
MRVLDAATLSHAVESQPSGVRLGEHLIRLCKISEADLYRALSVQAGLPFGAPARHDVSPAAAGSLPATAMRRWGVLPYRVDPGQLHVATAEVPSEEMSRDLASLSNLELRFRLVRPAELDRLAEVLAIGR